MTGLSLATATLRDADAKRNPDNNSIAFLRGMEVSDSKLERWQASHRRATGYRHCFTLLMHLVRNAKDNAWAPSVFELVATRPTNGCTVAGHCSR